MAHISMIDVPSDTYGEVTSLAKPLVDRLNHASMSRSTYTALSALLVWALARMEQVEQDLHVHEVHTGLVSAPETFEPEVKAEPTAPVENKPESTENAPLPAITASEAAEDAAVEAEIAKAEAEHAAKVVEPLDFDDHSAEVDPEVLAAIVAEASTQLEAVAASEVTDETVAEPTATKTVKRVAKPV